MLRTALYQVVAAAAKTTPARASVSSPHVRTFSTSMSARSPSTPSAAELAPSLKYMSVSQVKPFVYHVALNRPDKLNALHEKMWKELGDSFKALGQDPDCRSIVFSGNGKIFCSGIDLMSLASVGSSVSSDTDAAAKAKVIYNHIIWLQQQINELEQCPKPIVAAVHNGCVGGAIDILSATDVRFCTEDAYFQVKEVDVGLAADLGTLQRLPKLIGSQSVVRDLCFTARKMPSQEAERAGLVSRVFGDKDSMINAAVEMAENIAQKSPVAVQGTKVNLNFARDHTVQDGLEHIARWNQCMLQSSDMMTAAMAAMTREEKPPEFSKL